MANHKSSLKRIRQNRKIREQNRVVRATVRTAIKKTHTAIEAKDKTAAQEALKVAEVAIQKAAGHGIYHKNNAGRKVARLTQHVNALS